MKKSIIIIVFLVTVFNVYAQPSGYLGKKNSVSYSGLAFVPVAYILHEETGFVNYTHSLNFERVVEQRQSIGLRVQMFNTTSFVKSTISELTLYTGNNIQDSEVNDFYDLRVYAIAFDYIIYKRGWIAPLGRYNKISAMYIYYNSKNYLSNNKYVVNLEEEVSDYNIALTYTLGKRWIYNDLFTLKLASQLGVTLPAFLLNGSSSNNRFEYRSDIRLLSYMLYNFEVGVGMVF